LRANIEDGRESAGPLGEKSGDTDAKGREWTRSYLALDEAELRLWIVLE